MLHIAGIVVAIAVGIALFAGTIFQIFTRKEETE